MSEWWTYGLADFLMFSPEAYWRLVGRHNTAWWPGQLAGLVAALALPVLALRGTRAATRAALLLLALAWAWVAWSFHAQRYAEIFLAARWVAAAWGLQALLLLAALAVPMRDTGTPSPSLLRTAGIALVAMALLYPLLAPLVGQAWPEAEVFGWLPDPTALATAGMLCLLARLHPAVRGGLAVLPACALAFGAATRWLLA